jgi:hypothetical protein
MNTSSPHVAKSRDLVADFKKGIKRDPSLFPSLKHIDNWPTFKCETMAQAFAQDVVNIFNPKYKPQGSEEKGLFTLQLDYIYMIFCSNLKTDFGQKLVRDYESSQNAQAIWKELSNDAEKSTVAQLNVTDLLQYTILPKWRTGKALCFHSFSITKSRFGYMINYNLPTNRPPIM